MILRIKSSYNQGLNTRAEFMRQLILLINQNELLTQLTFESPDLQMYEKEYDLTLENVENPRELEERSLSTALTWIEEDNELVYINKHMDWLEETLSESNKLTRQVEDERDNIENENEVRMFGDEPEVILPNQ